MKIAIVCGSPSSEFLAPYHDKEIEIWVLGNRAHRHIDKRISKIFEIHDNLSEHANEQEYVQWLGAISAKVPVIVGEEFPARFGGAYPSGLEVYPYRNVELLYGSLYLTSSPAYMIAYAILYGATEIGLYGVDLSISDHEYFWQRPCVEAWIGFAKGRGVEVTIPEVSHVGKSSYIEGRDWGNDTEVGVFTQENFDALALEHEEKMKEIQDERHSLALKAAAHDGGMQVYKNLAKIARAVEAKIDVKSLKEAREIQ